MALLPENWMAEFSVRLPTYEHIYPRGTLEGKDVHAALQAQYGVGAYRAFNHGNRIVIVKNRQFKSDL